MGLILAPRFPPPYDQPTSFFGGGEVERRRFLAATAPDGGGFEIWRAPSALGELYHWTKPSGEVRPLPQGTGGKGVDLGARWLPMM